LNLNSVKAVEVIKHFGIYGLCDGDGCSCCHFEIQAIEVHVSCRKSNGAKPEEFWGTMIRVHSAHLECMPADLELVAREVVRQVKESEPEVPYMVRYSSYEQDAKVACVYCTKPRERYEDYLCKACKTGNDVWGTPIAQGHGFELLQA
jgi:hypothetical protein